MKYLNRLLEEKLRDSLKYFPAIAVLGARQVGKTTIVEKCFGKNFSMTTFDPVQDIGNARKDPDLFLQNLKIPAFLDEIQYAPELLSALKRKIDRDRTNGQYILSGSQNLAVVKNMAESLAGRVAILDLHPLCRRELDGASHASPFLEYWLQEKYNEAVLLPHGSARPLFPLLWRGQMPGLLEVPDRMVPEFWSSYLRTYIERDIRTVANIGDLQLFNSFFSLLAALSAQEINTVELGREIGLHSKTVRSWTSVAASTFQWHTVPSFSRNAIKKISGKAKGYLADTGMLCHLHRISSPEALSTHPLRGAVFETFIMLEILKMTETWPTRPNRYHYRTYAGAEIDLILEIDGKLFPVEIKSKANPDHYDGKAFVSFQECFPKERIGKGLLVCAVEQPTWMTTDLLAIPWWML